MIRNRYGFSRSTERDEYELTREQCLELLTTMENRIAHASYEDSYDFDRIAKIRDDLVFLAGDAKRLEQGR